MDTQSPEKESWCAIFQMTISQHAAQMHNRKCEQNVCVKSGVCATCGEEVIKDWCVGGGIPIQLVSIPGIAGCLALDGEWESV